MTVSKESSMLLAGLELYFPPGALNRDAEVAINEVVEGEWPPAPNGYASLGYRFMLEPANLSLQKPVTIRFSPPIADEATKDAVLATYDEASNSWITSPTRYESGALVAEIGGVSSAANVSHESRVLTAQGRRWNRTVDWLIFWDEDNPASDWRIFDQAKAWLPSATDNEIESLLKREVARGVKFENAIGSLLLSEAMWEKIRDGEYYESVSLAEIAWETLIPSNRLEIFQSVLGLISLHVASDIASFAVEVSLRALVKNLGIALTEGQLRAYLSWRGWIFDSGTGWYFEDQFSKDHEAVLSLPYRNNGWFRGERKPGKDFVDPFAMPGGDAPEEIFEGGKRIAKLLRRQVPNNGLAADREKLRNEFRALLYPEFELMIHGDGQGNGTVTAGDDGMSCHIDDGVTSGICALTYDEDQDIIIRATPDSGSNFQGWSGDCEGTSQQITIIMDRDKTCTVTFSLEQQNNQPPTIGGIWGVGDLEIDVGTAIFYEASDANDPDGDIVRWTWDFGDGTTEEYTSDEGELVIHRYSEPGVYTITLTIEDNDGATASASITQVVVAGFDILEDEAIDAGTVPAGTSAFTQGISLTDKDEDDVDVDVIRLEVDNVGTATANDISELEFQLYREGERITTEVRSVDSFPVEIYSGGSIPDDGKGRLLIGVNVAGDAIAGRTIQTRVKFRVHEGAGVVYHTMTDGAAESIGSSPTEFTLTIDSQGGGVVTLPGEGAFVYSSGSTVALEAVADTGYQFAGWTGDSSAVANASSASTTISIQGDHSITANFTQEKTTQRTLTVSKSGSGTGTVTSSPAGINCGSSCSASFDEGSSVSLVANPDSGSVFTGWSGDCSGTGSCGVTMSGDRSVTATFEEETVDAEILQYWPNDPGNPREVEVGEDVVITVTFENTSDTTWSFIAGATVWDGPAGDPDRQEVESYEWTGISVAPGDEGSASWSHTVNEAGDYWLQFGVWKSKPYVSENLLDAEPWPSEMLFQGVFGVNDRVQATTSLNVRDSAGGSFVGQVTSGEEGTVVDGPVEAWYDNTLYTWYRVDWDRGTCQRR